MGSTLEAAEERGRKRLHELLAKSAPHFTVGEMSEELGWEDDRVRRAVENRRLYVVEDEQGELLFPDWQVADGELVNGLCQVLATLRDAGWMGDILFFESEHALLGDRSPAEVLCSGEDIEKVKRAAAQEGRHGAA
jgi:hypothetical protein